MSRIYSVKSNARRDCRKLGIDPDLVVKRGDGWIIDYPDTVLPKKVKAPKAARSQAAKPVKPQKAAKAARSLAPLAAGETKRGRLVAMLADWTPISDLQNAMGWQAHTVRGALSTAAKLHGITIERQRVDGVTSYRVAG